MIGETLGSYRIVSLIGQGGMGVVYLAEHTLIGRKAAIKLLRPDVSRELVERFFNEARAAATLRHPGLVEVHDFGHTAEGHSYIVMELLEGESLAQRLQREARLTVPVAAMITRQVASALQVAHKRGIIHRDLKPENIFLVPDSEAVSGSRAKVLDFGIAKLSNDQVPRSVKTLSGSLFGTPRYMSPEQCKNARSVDGRADIYSLGCMFYEMLVGVPPFEYDSWAELVSAHLHETPPRPSELMRSLPADVEAVVLKMLAKRVEDRYASMQEVAEALEAVWRAHANMPAAMTLTPPRGVVRVVAGGRDPTQPAGSKDPTLPASGEMPAVVDDARTSAPTAPGVPAAAPLTPAPSPSRAASPRRRTFMIAGAIGGVAVVVGGAVGWKLMSHPNAASAAAEPAFIVVDQRGEPDGSAAAAPPAVVAAPVVTAPADAGTTVASPPAAPTDSHAHVALTEPDTRQLTRAFERQTGAVASCFREHPATTSDALTVRFQIDTRGHVVSAEVLPESVAGSPLATCLVGVARATAFGPQPKSVTFRVPIHASLASGG